MLFRSTPASRRQDHTLLPYATRLRQNFAGPGTGPSNSGAGAKSIVRPRAVACSRAKARPASRVAPDAAASTAFHPASVTIAIRPSFGTERIADRTESTRLGSEIFFSRGLDANFDLPDGRV